MKRTLFFMLLSVCLSAPAAWAYDFEADGIYYNITSSSDDKTVEVTYKYSYGGYYSGDVTIPATVTHNGTEYRVTAIGNHAFYNCSGLTSVTIGDNVATIGDYAFWSCSLTEITIPESVISIGNHAFYYYLTTVYFNAENCSQTNFCFSAFNSGPTLTTIHIGENVKQIPSYAFSGCKYLTEITIPNSVATIGERAFSSCSNLAKFEGKGASSDNRCLVLNDTLVAFAPGGLSTYTIPDNIKVIGNQVFYYCSDLTSVTIPNSVTAIGDNAFSWCDGLKSVTIGDNVATIGDEAFSGCTSLTSITIGNNVPTIGAEVFSGCSNLARFEGKWASSDNLCLVINDTLCLFASSGLSEYAIPDNIKVIGERAFEGRGLTSITIPESVISIGNGAFSGCYKLKEVRFNAISCINGSFASCKALTTVYIGNLVKQIPGEAFVCCENLTKVYFNAENCTQTNGCFSASNGCTALTTVNIGENVKQIPDEAFADCSSLTSITIGAGVNAIGERAFSGCTSLTSVAAYNPKPITIANDLFEGVDCKNCTLYVPAGSADLYRDAEGWNKFGAILPAIETVSDSLWYTNQSEDGKGVWNTHTPTWLSSPEAENVTLFSEGKIALFGDNDLSREDNKDIHTYFVDLEESFSIGGLHVDNSAITYHISADEESLTGTDGAVFEKKGSGVFYNDASLIGITTELYEGTIGRNSWRSRFLPIFGDKVVVKGEEATIDMGMNSDETGAKDAGVNISGDNAQYYRVATDLEIPENSTLNLIGARYGYMWKDTGKVVKVSGGGTLNLQMPGDRFFIGGGSKGEAFMGADFSEFYGTINVEKIGDDMIKMHTRKPNPGAEDGWEWVNDTVDMPVFSSVIIGPQTLKGKQVPANYYSSSLTGGESKLYDVWLHNRNFLDSICVDMKNVDLHIGNWGALCCGSSGATPNVTIVRVANLNVDSTGMLLGYYKGNDVTRLAIIFGSDNKDCYIQGTVTGAPKAISVAGYEYRNYYNKHGAADSAGFEIANPGARLIKEGTGTCYITANDNQMKEGLEVYEGAVMFNNTEYTATGSVGGTVVCRKDGTIGGTGAIGTGTLLYGTLQPGSNSIDTLRITRENGIIVYDIGIEGINRNGSETGPTHNLARGNKVRETKPGKGGNPNLRIYADKDQANDFESAAGFDMEIIDKNQHDMVDIEGELQVFDAEKGTIKLKVAPRGSWELNDGDTIVLIKAQGERCYEFGQKDAGYYGENEGEDVSCLNTFKLEPTAAFTNAGVEFHLAEVGTRTRNNALNDGWGGWEYPDGWQLVLVVDKGGKGEVPVAPAIRDFIPTKVTPADSSEVEALKTFTFEFAEAPSLAAEAQPITLAGNDTLLTATLAAGEGNTLEITLADTLKVAGEYMLTIPEGSFGDALFAADPTVGHCNPALTYTYTVKEPEPVEPDEPDEPSSITETQQDAEHIAVYNLQGVLVLETNDADDLKTLQNGAYIVNGKKMIIAR